VSPRVTPLGAGARAADDAPARSDFKAAFRGWRGSNSTESARGATPANCGFSGHGFQIEVRRGNPERFVVDGKC